TIVKVDSNSLPVALYALARESYTPVGKAARTRAMVEDTARFFNLMRRWREEETGVLRVVEELDIPAHRIEQALEHLDKLLSHWANQYHEEGSAGTYVVEMCAGRVVGD
ncbi:MAG: heterocyst differentiation control protein, partial [Cyanobacteria bacterium J06626_14]